MDNSYVVGGVVVAAVFAFVVYASQGEAAPKGGGGVGGPGGIGGKLGGIGKTTGTSKVSASMAATGPYAALSGMPASMVAAYRAVTGPAVPMAQLAYPAGDPSTPALTLQATKAPSNLPLAGPGPARPSLPPFGPITDEEKKSAEFVLFASELNDKVPVLPTTYVPAPYNVRPGYVSELTWAAYVAMMMTYRDPARAWRKSGKTPVPVPIDEEKDVWGQVVMPRITEYLKQRAAEIQAAKEGTVDVPPPGPVTSEEIASLDIVRAWHDDLNQPIVLSTDIVMAPWNRKPDWMTDTDWAALAALLLTYRNPTRAWMAGGHKAAPPFVFPNTAWSPTLARITAYIKTLQANG